MKMPWPIAGWLVALSCLPQFASLIVNMPRPVMAAALFFNGSLMFVAGIQLVVSRPITLRATLIIGLSLLSALSVLFFPEFYKSLPSWTRQFTGSEITWRWWFPLLSMRFFCWEPGAMARCAWVPTEPR